MTRQLAPQSAKTVNKQLDFTTLISHDSGSFTDLHSKAPTDKEKTTITTEPILPILVLEDRAAAPTAKASTDAAADRTQLSSQIIPRLKDDNFSTRQEASKDLQEFLAKDREKNIAAMSSLWKQEPNNLEINVSAEAIRRLQAALPLKAVI